MKTSIELFAGGGGLALGLEKAGFSSLALVDFNKDSCNTLKTNRPEWNVINKSCKEVNFNEYTNEVDLLSGGFPCQPFSAAGKQLGFEDVRGTAFFDFINIINNVKPKVVLMENVKRLKTHDKGKTFNTIKNNIQEIGYTIIFSEVMNSIYYNVPQSRERFIIISVRNDLLDKVIYTPPAKSQVMYTVKDALKKGKLYDSDVPYSVGELYSKNKTELLDHIPEGGNWRSLSETLQKKYISETYLKDKRGGASGLARRLSWDLPSPTLLTSPTGKITERCHPSETRPLTVREYARIQTFPDDWVFMGSRTSQYRQIGNAVPVNLAYAIATSIKNMLEDI